MKYLLILISIIRIIHSNAQGVIGNLETSILYKSFDNKINVGFKDNFQQLTINVKGGDYTVLQDGYLIRTNKNVDTVLISFYDKNKKEVFSKSFKCIDLPIPHLCWGGNWGSYALVENTAETFLKIENENNLFIGGLTYNITNWQVKIANEVIIGTGNLLSEDVKKLIYSKGTRKVEVNISVNYTSNLLKPGRLSGNFIAINPYANQIPSKNDIYIIDKDSTNMELFDETNPISLLSAIKYQAGRYSPSSEQRLEYLNYHVAERLINDKQQLFYDLDLEGDDMLIETDTLSPNYGFEKTIENKGIISYVYPQRIPHYFDLTDITRFVFYRSEIIDPITQLKSYTISHIGIAKKYNNAEKYDVVLVLPMHEVADYKYIDRFFVPALNRNEYLLLLDQINAVQTKTKQIADFNYYKRSPNGFYTITTPINSSPSPSPIPKITNQFVNHYSPYEESNGQLFPHELFDSITYCFDSTLVTWDTLGNELTKENQYYLIDTLFCNLFASRDSIYPFLRFSAQGEFGKLYHATDVIYALKTRDGYFAFCSVSLGTLNQNFNSFMVTFSTDIYIDNDRNSRHLLVPWKTNLASFIDQSKHYNLTNKKHVKLLSKEFNLDTYKGEPVNLLGVCNGCK